MNRAEIAVCTALLFLSAAAAIGCASAGADRTKPASAAGSASPASAPRASVGPPQGWAFERDPEQPSTASASVVPQPALLVKWTAKVGVTTFRTTLLHQRRQVIIGTHGSSRDGLGEQDDGVYILDGKTGARATFIATPATVGGQGRREDLDVGGVAASGDSVVFTTDNGQVVSADRSGHIRWQRKLLEGKVRPAPALAQLGGDATLDVVVGDEAGVLWALDGASGEPLWRFETGQDDRVGIVGAVAIGAVDADGVLDVIAGARDGVLRALSGATGQVLWEVTRDSGMHASPMIADLDGDGRREVLASWSYGDVVVVDLATGKELFAATLRQDDGGIEGLFGSPMPVPGIEAPNGPKGRRGPAVLLTGTSWWGAEDGVVGLGQWERRFKHRRGRVSATAVVASLGGVPTGIVGTESGDVIGYTAAGQARVLARVGAPIEAPALLADVDGDGGLELLVGSTDGKLTCFGLPSGSRAIVAAWRGPAATMTGDLGSLPLAWGRAAKAEEPPLRHAFYGCCSALGERAGRQAGDTAERFRRAERTCRRAVAKRLTSTAALAQLERDLGGEALPPQCR